MCRRLPGTVLLGRKSGAGGFGLTLPFASANRGGVQRNPTPLERTATPPGGGGPPNTPSRGSMKPTDIRKGIVAAVQGGRAHARESASNSQAQRKECGAMTGSSRTRRRRCRLCGLQPEEGSSRHPPKTVALWPCDLGASSASQVASMLLARGRPKGILAPLLAPVGPVARLLEASAVRSSWSRQGHRVSDFEKRRGSRRRRAETGAHARPPWRAGGV